MSIKVDRCPKCGQNATILPSRNPLVKPTCLECVVSELDYNKTEHGDFFCRTYNIPFKPEL